MITIAVFAYGTAAYVLFLAAFLYLVGFLANLGVPKSIDTGMGGETATAFLVNLGLLSVFALQHSVMARPSFKRWWTRVVPVAIERSTYVLLTNVVLGLLFWQWRPMTAVIWDVSSGTSARILEALFCAGWIAVLLGTFMTNHFELFGLRQVYLYLVGREHTPVTFTARGFYRYVRHPLMAGFLLAFWATPRMTLGHLVFSMVMTGYVLLAIRFEERDLVESLGEQYVDYRESTPALLPRGRRAGR